MAHPRIDGIVASDAPLAVIFRRGPSKLTQQLLWNLETDEVTSGQWIRGRVYTRRCDLSPDGKLLVGAYTNYSTRTEHKARLGEHPWSHCGWTAVSRPPYFTAVALWFTGGAWNGGGLWISQTELAVNNFAHHWEPALAPPDELKVRPLNLGPSEDEPLYSMLLAKRGWREVRPFELKLLNPGWRKKAKAAAKLCLGPTSIERIDSLLELMDDAIPRFEVTQAGLWTKPFPGGALERLVSEYEVWGIRAPDGGITKTFKLPTHGSQLLDIDHRGRVVYGDQGCLWAWPNCPEGEPLLIADLRANRFEPVAPPDWATTWP